MQFLAPAAFYLLGVIPIVVLLHFLKLRRYTYLVPSIRHWLSVDEDRSANVPFQRIRNLLLPLLQVLFLILLICGVARPALRRPGFMPGRAILIVDNSASMLSEENRGTRLSLAKAAALDQIERITASGGIMVLVTQGADTYIQQAFTTDAARLRDAIANIMPTHAPRNLAPVFDVVRRYSDSPQDKVFFISDSVENVPDIPISLHKIAVGSDAENVGIVHLSLDVVQGRYEVLVGVQNFTDTAREFNVQLAVENSPLDDRPVTIPSEGTTSVLFSGDSSGLAGKVMSVHLGIEDDFWLDNTASVILSDVSALNILLVSENQRSLLPALLSSYGHHVDLSIVAPVDYHGTGDADIAIFDGSTLAGREAFGGAFEIAPRTCLVFINPGGVLPFVAGAAAASGPARVIKTDAAHPLMADVSLQGLHVRESTYRDLPLWGHSVVETERGALIWLGEEAGTLFLVFEFDAFNPEISAFAVSIPAGPLFVYRCLAWLESGTARLQPLTFQEGQTRHAFRTGEQVNVAFKSEGTRVYVQKPDGTRVPLNTSLFSETDQVGVYTFFAVDGRQLDRFTVNLLDAAESALTHSVLTDQEDALRAFATDLQPVAQEVWRLPVLLALVVLFVEWWFYHRERL